MRAVFKRGGVRGQVVLDRQRRGAGVAAAGMALASGTVVVSVALVCGTVVVSVALVSDTLKGYFQAS
ncbi:MAG: hypothetical protein LBJ41_10110 [Treponema sp.]|nr:hypothetical protein [Treponema sp.]